MQAYEETSAGPVVLKVKAVAVKPMLVAMAAMYECYWKLEVQWGDRRFWGSHVNIFKAQDALVKEFSKKTGRKLVPLLPNTLPSEVGTEFVSTFDGVATSGSSLNKKA